MACPSIGGIGLRRSNSFPLFPATLGEVVRAKKAAAEEAAWKPTMPMATCGLGGHNGGMNRCS
jgi:hypothetical protein